MPPTKGAEIRFVRGTYAGHEGWLDTSKVVKSGRYCAVIVNLDGEEKATRVSKSSVRNPFQELTTFEEAAIQQYPEIQITMIRLAQMMAECNVENDTESLRLFQIELKVAHDHQEALGNKAQYRHVDF